MDGNGKMSPNDEYCVQCNQYDVARATNNPFVDSYLLLALRKKNRNVEKCVAHRKQKQEYEKTFENYMLPPSEWEKWGRFTAAIAIVLLSINVLATYLLYKNYAILVKNENAGFIEFDMGFWLLVAGIYVAGGFMFMLLVRLKSWFKDQIGYLLFAETAILVAGAMQIFWVGFAVGIGVAAWIFFSFTSPTEPIPIEDLRVHEKKAKDNLIAWLVIITALLGLLFGAWYYLTTRG